MSRRKDLVLSLLLSLATVVVCLGAAEIVLRFIRTHPLYARVVVRLVGYVDSIDHPDDVLRAKLLDVPVMALTPTTSDARSR